ncbi:DUF305 domain-containing protein [Streptomyces sp. NPDC088789]|uniref:DUF305 domain-containing protein n=1 Tax=Streptomyces sp. NPDC088789 TaxID=3365899 RepID=UPI0038029B04
MTAHRMFLRRAAMAAVGTGAALVLAACGSGSDDSGAGAHGGHDGSGASASPSTSASSSPSGSGSASQGEHNPADVAFAQGMIPHHRQAVEMADLAPGRAGSEEVKTLAKEIKKAQDPEIRTMTGWLDAWGEEVPADGGSSGHEGHSMAGMMTEEEMKELEGASGEAFDTAFLKLMVKHHEGAVEMAEAEKKDGAYQPALDLADAVITTQSAEITRMNGLLGKG